MNVVDVVLVVFLIGAIQLGVRIGVVRQLSVTIGFVIGTVAAAGAQHFFASIANTRSDEFFFWELLLLTLLIVGLFFDVGWWIGTYLHKKIERLRRLGAVDGIGGGIIAGITGIGVALLLTTLLLESPNPVMAAQLKESSVINGLRQAFPKLPDFFVSAANLLDPHALPQVFAGQEPAVNSTGTAPTTDEARQIASGISDSVVKVSGFGCGGTVTGTGFVVGDSLVMTNAHVVAGLQSPKVTDQGGDHLARLIAYDPKMDIAVLVAKGLKGKALEFIPTGVENRTGGVTLGYATGVLAVTPAEVAQRVNASGYDIYNQSIVVRSIYMLYGRIEPGDSGGPFITRDQKVAGVVFAKPTDSDTAGYALTSDLVLPKLQGLSANSPQVSSGECGVE